MYTILNEILLDKLLIKEHFALIGIIYEKTPNIFNEISIPDLKDLMHFNVIYLELMQV